MVEKDDDTPRKIDIVMSTGGPVERWIEPLENGEQHGVDVVDH
jgi:hypothetical protein